METLSLSSIFDIASNNVVMISHNKHGGVCLLKVKNKSRTNIIYCQSGSKGSIKSSGSSSVIITERSSSSSSTLINDADDQGALMETTRSLILTPNGSTQTTMNEIHEIHEVRDLVPYSTITGSTSTSLIMERPHEDDGIGITKFLGGKTFLVTGATGFLGKGIYMIIDVDLFKCLKQTHGKSYQAFMLSKIVPVVGNVCETNLGLDKDTMHMLVKEVDIIINSAANTTFDERYDVALDINTRGPSRLMTFTKQCRKVKLFLQTFILCNAAYVNGRRQGTVMEKAFSVGESIAKGSLLFGADHIFLPTLNVKDEIKLVLESKQAVEDNVLAQEMKSLGLERANKFGWQDTYVFTKAMGEMLIDRLRGNIPVVIIRPSVIESTYREPFPGWMEGNRMMDPVVLYYGKGQLSGFLVDPNGVLDVVPVDMAVNATLAAMAKHREAGKSECNVYQIASSVVNPLVFKDLATLVFEHFNSFPWVDSKGKPIRVPKMELFCSMEDFASHLWRHAISRSGLAAMAQPGGGKMSKKYESICRKSVEQAKYLANLYEPYTFYVGRLDNSNTQLLMGCMSKEEIRQFGFDVENIDWKDYISNIHIPGLRRHVMKGRMGCS
ncbi:hypothetical protein ACH5RR_002572 [Cinchona calisaya]|uniref:Fatty acyl-CoA reductase n=1 Tax=Cinchona calisaya TaxID=153742 RepID=A0ABD3ASR1_9GENT